MVGLTEDEITMIRDIWSGKTPVEHGQKTFEASENYEGKAFVNIKALGHKEISMMVDKGTKIDAPYQLDESMSWFSKGNPFDFATPINEATFIYADYALSYYVTIHFTGIAKEEEVLVCNAGTIITLDQYEIEGFIMHVVSDERREISKLEVSRDAYINIIYIKK
jgi:hypothetical protein